MQKKRKSFYRENVIDQLGNSRGFSPTHNLTTVQIGSYLWMLGGGYIGSNIYSLPKGEYQQNMNYVFHKVELFSGSGPCYGSKDNCHVRNPDFLSDPFIKICDCVLEEQTELWSMQKSRFIPSSLQLPFGIHQESS